MVDPFGLSGKLTIYSDSPKGDPIGHAFIGVTEKGKTTYIGQWPGTADNIGFEKGDLPRLFFSKMDGTLVSPDTSHLRSSELTSISFDLDDKQMSNLKKYVDNFDVENATKGYNLRNRQCASFAYGASQAAGIKEMKMPWYKWVTPATLAKKIDSLKSKIKCPS